LAEVEAMEAEATEGAVTATEEATEEAACTVTLSAVIGEVIISQVMALADTVLLGDTLLSTEVMGEVIILQADTVLLDDVLQRTAAMVGPATILPAMALGAVAVLVA
jgi:hypothetical protein